MARRATKPDEDANLKPDRISNLDCVFRERMPKL